MSTPHLLLTGASGSTAGNLLRMDAFTGFETTCISRSGNILRGNKSINNLIADLGQANLSEILPQRADIIVHGAAMVPKKSASEVDYEINLQMAENLARYAWDNRLGHLVFISTGSVYGPDAKNPGESTPADPGDAYGRSMRKAEEILESIKGKVPLTVIRLFYPYGFDQHTAVDNLVAKLFLRVANGQPITIGEQADHSFFRPTFMPDLAKLVSWILANRWTGTLNVAGPDAISLRQMVEAMGKVLGKQPEIGVKTGMGVPGNAEIYLLKSLHAGFSWTSFAEGLPKAANSLNLLPKYE